MIAEVRGAVARRVGAMGRKQISTGKKAVILLGFCTAQLLDIATTHIGLSEGHQELNGIAAWIIAHNGELAVYAIKLGLGAALVAFLLIFGRRRAGIWNAYLVAAWITTFAVVNNLYRILS
ncbi:MAG: hypothetical protein E6I16_01180 [Chloroflexi bacterium]|nr:MAG: hypothetical protein E6I16_01180 [Chloroflexota bacterium]